jgi:hypothetical protein
MAKAATQNPTALVEAPPAAQLPANPVVSMLEKIMSDQTVSVERVEQAFAFYQKVEADQAKKAFTRDFVQAESEMEQIKKEAKSDKGKYASFDALDGAMRPVYSKYGFAFSHTTELSSTPDNVLVVTYLIHKDGHERRYQIDMPADGKGAKGNDVMTRTHAVASANTYGKRYNIGNAFNIATYTDDDGKAAAGKTRAEATTRSVREQMPAADSADKRAEILKDLRALSNPMTPADMDNFSTKWGGTIESLRKSDADDIRAAFKERMPQNGK